MTPRRAVAGALALAVTAALALPAAALAVTDEDVQNMDTSSGSPEPAPHLDTGAGSSGLRVLLGLAVVVGVIFVVWAILKRTQRHRLPGGKSAAAGGTVSVLSTTPVGPNRHLHLVRVGEDVLLLGATEHGIATLHTLDHETAREQGLLDGSPPPAAPAPPAKPPAAKRPRPAAVPDQAVPQAVGDLTLAPPVPPADAKGAKTGGRGVLDGLRDRTAR